MAEGSEEVAVENTNTETATSEVDARDKEIDRLKAELEQVKKEKAEAVNTLNTLSVKGEEKCEFDEIFNKKGD